MRKGNPVFLVRLCIFFLFEYLFLNIAAAQVGFPVNGIAEPKEGSYVFTHATIVKDAHTILNDATMAIRNGKIVSVSNKTDIPKDAIEIDCKGKYIYPSFIDIFSDYGMPAIQRPTAADVRNASDLNSSAKGAYGWNQAIKPQVDAWRIFSSDRNKARVIREAGFGTVLSHVKDGIARGTGVVVSVSDKADNFLIIKEAASAHYSFLKGTSSQIYPSSLMGSIALLRQTYYDALWYKTKPTQEGINLSLQAWINNQKLPQIFDADAKWNDIRADRIGDEFGVQYIIKGGGDEYQRIKEIAATKATYIISLNFPMAMDVEDPADARFVSLSTMKHWELAPSNAASLEKANIAFCLSAADLRDVKFFMPNLRKAIQFGLTETTALEALTKTPAKILGIYDTMGSLETGKLANFLVTSGPIFQDKSVILQNWVQGEKYAVNENRWNEMSGVYKLVLNAPTKTLQYTFQTKNPGTISVISSDTVPGKIITEGNLLTLQFPESKHAKNSVRLSGVMNGSVWNGMGEDSAGNKYTWTATFLGNNSPQKDTARKKEMQALSKITFPFNGYGMEEPPSPENILIRNATVWTNEKDGILQNTDVLIKNGKIVNIGKDIKDATARVFDATGKHVTPGIIDEHSHIAVASINELGKSVTSEVRIADNLDPEDINIYRQLSGGVTTSHILHGSANTIGGQTQVIKLRWGKNDEGLKFKDAAPFIKFALGENVKQTRITNNTRFPDTRMGVEQTLADAFQRARDYEAAMKNAESTNKKKPVSSAVRKDLELDALVEILNNKRFITAHSYIQSEITALLRIGDKYGFKVNTFTHILEGYKVADKMKERGATASTFSDWWAYKVEVQDAIPYNASIMQRVGLNVCINSDDPEMARRLNQEAAKSIKYGGMSEEDALKMVTLNPAKALHIEDKVGSLKVGKDADIVIWSDHPLSIYAKAEKTIVDGTVYFDRERDLLLRKEIASERNRLVQKMIGEKRSGASVQPALPSFQVLHNCGDHEDESGLLDIDETDIGSNE